MLDINIISEFIRKTPDAQVMLWLRSVQLLTISVITLEEAQYGFAWHPDAAKFALFNAVVKQLYAVYPITAEIAQHAGQLRGQFQAQGTTRSAPDMLIAATAQAHQLIVVTRNVRDFAGCGVQVVNPFEKV